MLFIYYTPVWIVLSNIYLYFRAILVLTNNYQAKNYLYSILMEQNYYKYCIYISSNNDKSSCCI
jgi:hypothetical protein